MKKDKVELVYKVTSYRVTYEKIDYIVSFDYDNIRGYDNRVVVESSGEVVEDELAEKLINFTLNDKEKK